MERYKIIRRAGRRSLVVRWFDERRGLWREKALGVTRRREAEKIAAEAIRLEQASDLMAPTWDALRAKYETERGPFIGKFSQVKSAFNRFEEICDPSTLAAITPGMYSRFEAGLRLKGLAEASILTYMKAIRTIINWAVELELLDRAPRMKLPRQARVKIMKGRPITGEEFDRLLAAATGKDADHRDRSTVPLLRGLYLSGLRLEEALRLWWDREDMIHVDNLDGRRPVLHIPAGSLQKNGKETYSPLTPDFVAFLRETPSQERQGAVFNVLGIKCDKATGQRKVNRSPDYVGRIISGLGERAKILVDRDRATGDIKWASAHDLRRSFGDRWSQRVMPVTLKEMMRHAAIETTMKYYVGRSAEMTADVIWSAPADVQPLGANVTHFTEADPS